MIKETRYPRSYRVQTPTGVLRRNRRDSVSLPRDSEPQEEQTTQSNESQSQTEFDDNTRVTTHSGRVTKPPERLMTVSIVNDLERRCMDMLFNGFVISGYLCVRRVM